MRLLSRAWMMLHVHALQLVHGHVRVYLRRRDIGMAEDGLHGAKVCAVLYHVCGTTVAQHMRTGVTSAERSRLHKLPHAITCEPVSALRKKEMWTLLLAG